MASATLRIGQFGNTFAHHPREVPRVPPLTFLPTGGLGGQLGVVLHHGPGGHGVLPDEIYVSSASCISIDAPLSSIGSDSGIYNTSTDCSSCSGVKVTKREETGWDQNIRTLYNDQEFVSDYDVQDVCIWMDSEGEPETEDEVYETIYDIIDQQTTTDSDFDDLSGDFQPEGLGVLHPRDRKKNINKMASAAGRKIRKLRRNWSLKKNDLTRSFSKIRRSSQFYLDDSSSLGSEETSLMSSLPATPLPLSDLIPDLPAGDNTSFRFTLTVELPDQQIYMEMTGNFNRPVPPTRRKSRRNTQVIRPNVPPPAPPIPPLPLSPPPHESPPPPRLPALPPPSQEADSPTLPAISFSFEELESCIAARRAADGPADICGFSNGGDICGFSGSGNCGGNYSLESAGYGGSTTSYTYSLLNSEPLYQFYDGYVTSSTTPLPSDQEHTYESIYVEASLSIASKHQQQQQRQQQQQQQQHYFLLPDSPLFPPRPVENSNNKRILRGPELAPKPPLPPTGRITRQLSSTQLISRPSPSDPMKPLIGSSTKLNAPTSSYSRDLAKTSRCSALDLLQQGKRTLWSEIPEVRESGVLSEMSENQRNLQEAKFEILTSEASYLKSLNVLTTHFLPKLTASTADQELAILFSHVHSVRSCSEKFLSELDQGWKRSYLLCDIIRILLEHARRDFHVYIKYCSNQIHQEKTLKKLMSDNPKFSELLRELETSEICQSLSLHSFLMLPMQRVTRLPLLVSALISRLPSDAPESAEARECISVLNSLVEECNEGARSVYRMEEMIVISKQLDFRDLKPIGLVSSSRWLVRQTEAIRVQWKESTESVRLTFGKRNHKQTLVLYLFTDLLVITKKKSDEKYAVMDYCARNLLQISELNREDSPIPGLPEHNCWPVWLTLLQNNENKTQEMLVYFSQESERKRWITLLNSTPVQEGEETVYADWDSPQVELVADIVTGEVGRSPAEMAEGEEVGLEKGARARVLRQAGDLLLVEEDGTKKKLWVKKVLTREIFSDHLRAKNFRQRYSFLKSLSQSLES